MSALNPEKLSPQTSSLKDFHSKQLPPLRQKRPILPFWRAIWDDFVPYRPSGDQKCFPPSCDFVPYCPSRRAIWDEIVPYCPPEGQYGTNLARGGQYGTVWRCPMVPSLTTLVNTMCRVTTGCWFESPAGQVKITNSLSEETLNRCPI